MDRGWLNLSSSLCTCFLSLFTLSWQNRPSLSCLLLLKTMFLCQEELGCFGNVGNICWWNSIQPWCNWASAFSLWWIFLFWLVPPKQLWIKWRILYNFNNSSKLSVHSMHIQGAKMTKNWSVWKLNIRKETKVISVLCCVVWMLNKKKFGPKGSVWHFWGAAENTHGRAAERGTELDLIRKSREYITFFAPSCLHSALCTVSHCVCFSGQCRKII